MLLRRGRNPGAGSRGNANTMVVKALVNLARLTLKLSLSVAFGFLLLEALMTLADPLIAQGLYQYDREMGFRVRPHVNGTNEFGFNAPDFPHEKPPGVEKRVLILSDSYNWMGNRDWNYTVRLQKKLDALHGGRRVEIINAGYPMTHTAEQLPVLRRFGLQYRPDVVVLGFFAGNDFFDASPRRKRIVVNDTLIDIDPADETVVFGYPILPRSRFLAFVQQKWVAAKETNPRLRDFVKRIRWSVLGRADDDVAASPIPVPQQGTFSRDTYLDLENARLQVFNVRTLQRRGYWVANVDYILDAMGQMAELCRERGVRFVVAIYPDEVQVNDALFQEIVERYGSVAYRYDLDTPTKVLGPHLDALGVPWIDFRERFREEARTRVLYVPNDTHWNQTGNDLAADILAAFLKPWLPEPPGAG